MTDELLTRTMDLMKVRLGWEMAIEAAGSATKLGEMIGVTRACVSSWKWRGIPPTQCLKVNRATNVPLHQLRPDVYPEPEKSDSIEA